MEQHERPPLGLVPREIHDWRRIVDIVEAIERYSIAGKPVDKEWVSELKELLKIAKRTSKMVL